MARESAELPWVQSLSSADLSVQESRLRYRPSALVSAPALAPALALVSALASALRLVLRLALA